MNKKLVGTICGIIMIVCGATCSIAYAIGNSNTPWWLLVFAGGIACAIISMIGNFQRENDKQKKHKLLISCICASISMISVFIFLTLMIATNMNNAWIIVFVGGIISGIIYMIDNAINNKE